MKNLTQYQLSSENQNRLNTFIDQVKTSADHFMGYPIAQDFDYTELFPLFHYPLNNVGDPLIESTYELNSRSLELEVINFFKDFFRAPKNNSWGYVTNGGTEGNLYGLYLARELYPKGMVYYSESTHYSVQKNIQLLNMESIVIRSNDSGEMDYNDLRQSLSLNRSVPAIIFANIGTTMTEARDDLRQIKGILSELAVKNHYIHTDCALAGGYAPFMDPKPAFDFADGADSMSISGHKFIGSPIPCGVVMVKKAYRDRVGRMVDYVDTMDTTITGSRNGHSPLFLWYTINKLGLPGLKDRYLKGLDLAEYALKRLTAEGISAWKNSQSLTVLFPTPDKQLCVKWQLASENGTSHVICMPGVAKARLDLLLNDLIAAHQLKKAA